MKKVPAIILSAGASKRMGFPKALLRFGRSTLLEDQIRRLKKAGCSPVIVVLGAGAKKIIPYAGTDHVVNRSWELGQFSSIKRGLRSLNDVSRGCVILPVDVPFVPVSVIKKIIKTSEKKTCFAIIPRSTGTGHPVWLSPISIRKVLRLSSRKGRLDHILAEANNVVHLKVTSGAILGNVNTKDGLQRGLKEPSEQNT